MLPCLRGLHHNHWMRYHVLLFAVSALAPLAAEAQTQPQGTPRLTLPPVTVTAQKEPADRQNVPVSVTAVPKETLWDAKITAVSEASIYAPERLVQRVLGPQAQQRVLPRRRLEPEQSRRHDLHRRRAAAERQLVEHRVQRHRPSRVRARRAERALRPQLARRRHQHRQRAAVAQRLDRQRRRAIRRLRDARGARRRSPGRSTIGWRSAPRAAARIATASRSTRSAATTSTRGEATFGKAQVLWVPSQRVRRRA